MATTTENQLADLLNRAIGMETEDPYEVRNERNLLPKGSSEKNLEDSLRVPSCKQGMIQAGRSFQLLTIFG